MALLKFAALLLGALVPAHGADAQDRLSSDDEQIVVTGERSAEREIRDFVRALTPSRVQGQLSRFEWAICPAALGVSPGQKEKLVSRIRRVARAVEAPLADPGCSPNLLLVVTENKKAFIGALRRRQPAYFGDMSPRQLRQLLREPGPAAVWHVDGPLLNADGQPIGLARASVISQQPDSDGSFLLNDIAGSASRVGAGARSHFVTAVLIVEAKALDGLTTTQLADYAAVRTLARVDPSRLPAKGQPTILKVLEAPMGEAVPVTLTPADLGFLRGLYASERNLYAGAQRSRMREAVEAELKQAGEERP